MNPATYRSPLLPETGTLEGPGNRRIFYGWWMAALAGMMVIVATVPLEHAMPLIVSALRVQYDWSIAAISLVHAITSILPMSLLSGYMSDRIGPRKTMLAGLPILAGSLILFSLVRSIWMLFPATLLIMVGSALSGWIPAMTVINRWFDRRRATATAMAATVGALWGSVPLIPYYAGAFIFYRSGLDAILPSVTYWRFTAVALCGAILIVAIPVQLWLYNRPEDLGMRPDGNPASEEQSSISTPQALRQRAFWLLLWGEVLTSASFQGALVCYALLANDRALNGVLTSTLVMFPIVSFSFILAGGLAGDRFSKSSVLALFTLPQVGGTAALAFAGTPVALILAMMLVGMAVGGRSSVSVAIVADYFGMNSFGKILGLLMVPTGLLLPITSALVGWMWAVQESYTLAFLFLTGLSLLGGYCYFKAHPPHTPQVGEPKAEPG